MARVHEARGTPLGQRALLPPGGQGGQREPAVLDRLGDLLDVLGPLGLVHQALGLLVRVQGVGVVGALDVVGVRRARVEVEAVQFLAEGGDVLVHHAAQLRQLGPGLLLLALLGAAEEEEDAGAGQGHQHDRDDHPGDRGAVVDALALGLRGGLVDEVVQGGVDVTVVGPEDGTGDPGGGTGRHRAAVRVGPERVAAPDRVDPVDPDQGAQVLEDGVLVVGRRVRDDRDEDRLVGLLDLLGQGVGLGLAEPVGHRRVDVDLALLQGGGGIAQPAGGRGRRCQQEQQPEQRRHQGKWPGAPGTSCKGSHAPDATASGIGARHTLRILVMTRLPAVRRGRSPSRG